MSFGMCVFVPQCQSTVRGHGGQTPMHSCRDFALVFSSTLCFFCPVTAAGMRGRSGASSSSPSSSSTPLRCVFLTQISFVTLFLQPSLILYFFLSVSGNEFVPSHCARGDFFPLYWEGGGCYLVRLELCVVVRNQSMTSPLGRECVFALFLECRPVKVCVNVRVNWQDGGKSMLI